MLLEKLRFQGTQIALPAQDARRLARFLCEAMSTAAMLSHIRKPLRCNQALPGGQAFDGIDALPRCWLPFGQIRNGQCSLPSLPKYEGRSCSEVQPPEHRMPEAASPGPRPAQAAFPGAFLCQRLL